MGFGPFSSESRTSSRVNQYDQRVTATDHGVASQSRVGGQRNRAAQAVNGIAIEGEGNTVNLTDGGAFATAADLVKESLAVTAAATRAGLEQVAETTDQLAGLSETKLTDGANLNQKTTVVAVIAFAVIALAAFLFLRRAKA
jgi:hypothetical protein